MIKEMKTVDEEKHFVLVHGACHGAWCWYKVKPQLESAGHRVTVLDLAASGINMKLVEEAGTLEDYSKPLLEMMASLSPDERVILVGHSLGGLSLALAMDKFPNKVSLAIFIAAFMPDTIHQKLYVFEKLLEKIPRDSWMDTQFLSYGTSNEAIRFGPKFLSSTLYQLSPVEDLELATMLMRPASLFLQDLTNTEKFSNEGYGSVTRVYIGGDEDKIITKEVQLSMIENSGVKEVMEIKGADHMSMFSKPQQLCECLLELANKYA